MVHCISTRLLFLGNENRVVTGREMEGEEDKKIT